LQDESARIGRSLLRNFHDICAGIQLSFSATATKLQHYIAAIVNCIDFYDIDDYFRKHDRKFGNWRQN